MSSSSLRNAPPILAATSAVRVFLDETPSVAVGSSANEADVLGFTAFDAALSVESAHGVLVLATEDEATATAALQHAERRLRAAGRTPIVVPTAVSAIYAEVAALVGVSPSQDVPELAAALAAALGPHAALLVGAPTGPWDAAVGRVLEETFEALGSALLVRAERGAATNRLALGYAAARSRQTFEIGAELGGDALSAFWEAAFLEARQRPDARRRVAEGAKASLTLGEAGAWWTSFARGIEHALPAPRPSVLDGDDERLARRLALVGRAISLSAVANIASSAAVGRLVAAGRAVVADGRLLPTATEAARASGDASLHVDDVTAAAGLLQQISPDDPFACARAAELLASVGLDAQAEVAHVRAISLAQGTAARAELWSRWSDVASNLPEKAQLGCRMRGAELALARGDVDVALEWAQRAVRLAPSFASLLLVGKATLGRGDLVAARATLERALAVASDAHDRSAVEAELAEVAYTALDHENAGVLATAALGSASDPAVRLRASNTLGKVLLAAERWSEAERHFADDESLAGCFGDTTGELRARLNRAIAVLSDGRLDEAHAMLSSVLADGARKRDDRAVARALMNLAVMAINAQRYGEALQLSERAISVRRRLGERVGLAWIITNLAELRLRLGLIDEADQAVAFGRSTLSAGDGGGRGARFSLVRAGVLLARGDTLGAAREIAAAHAQGPTAATVRELGELAVRVALADGDVARAEAQLTTVIAAANSHVAHAAAAVLRVELARAKGDPDVTALVREAVTAAQRAQQEDLLREAHVLGAAVARAEGDDAALALHLERATASRDRVAETLSETVRSRFLDRPELRILASLEQDAPAPVSLPTRAAPLPSARPSGSLSRTLAGRDPAMRALGVAIGKIARSGGTVLVQGESGTGKELVAEAIHAASDRASAPLVKVNCAALVESLLLSELFGHEKGAFTGALGRRRGRFEAAEGGTLFLDEIGDISPATQVALLRVLQERTFERVGGTSPIHADVRVVCATHRDLKAMVERGEFRKDLYFRLSGLQLSVPSLRSRTGDLPAIADALLERFAEERGEKKKTLSADAVALLVRHRWPGNVRELENALRAASVFAEGATLLPSDFTDHVEAFRTQAGPVAIPSATPTLTTPIAPFAPFAQGARAEGLPAGEGEVAAVSEEGGPIPDGDARATELLYAHLKAGQANLFDMKRQIERDCIARALAETRGNITRAASILGMKRPRLSQLVKQYNLGEVSLEGS